MNSGDTEAKADGQVQEATGRVLVTGRTLVTGRALVTGRSQ